MMNQVYVTKVVSRNFLVDIWASVQNMFGKNLTGYEKMVSKGMKQIEEETKDFDMKWFRYEITQLGNGAISITFYGEKNERT